MLTQKIIEKKMSDKIILKGHVENIYAEVENWDVLINEFFDTELSN